MDKIEEIGINLETEATSGSDEFQTNWADNAPRGGKAVLNRILRDGAKVPLFFGQTLINSLRDVGYNNTTSALCEHVDNAIQWGASEVRLYFHQAEAKGPISILVHDNGKGMAPHVLKVAASFGGSMVFGSRREIGRYGMGMKTAALSLSPGFEIYSWQEPKAIYSMALDVQEIGNNRANLIELPDPELNEQLPKEIRDILTRPLTYPKDPNDSQELLARNAEELYERLGNSGTIIFMSECDRLYYQKVSSLVDHATKEMARIYRRFIEKGIRIYVNNRVLEAFDPTYSSTTARHSKIDELQPKQSRLLATRLVEVPVAAGSNIKTKVRVKLFILPYEQWTKLGKATLKNKLHLFEDYAVSFLRNSREVAIGSSYPKLKVPKHHYFNWIRLEIEFTGEADEGFGIASNKQGVRLKQYVYEPIVAEIGEDIKNAREMVRVFHAESAARKSASTSEAERRATEAEPFQGQALPELSESEVRSLDDNLRALAVVVKRDEETDEDAYQRLRQTDFATIFKHDPYWPFYHCDFKFGKVITTINTAHPFFTKVWEPLSELSKSASSVDEDSEGGEPVDGVNKTSGEILAGLQALLLSLARTQSQIAAHDKDGAFADLFVTLQKEWSNNLATQLNVK